MARFVILGDGLLGAAVAEHLARRGTPHVVLDHAAVDAAGSITQAAAPHTAAGDVVVNAAAMTNLDECEVRASEAMEVNGHEPGRLAALCVRRGATLVHVSTDTVLDVTNVYAKSKALAERVVTEAAGDRALIVRVSTLFAPHPRRTDFVRFVLKSLHEKGEVKAAVDMICSPTYAVDAARAMVAAVHGGARGTHQFVNEPRISRFDFALWIQRSWGAPGVVHRVRLDDLPLKAPRARDTSMRSTLDAWHAPLGLDACFHDYRARSG